MIRAIIFDMDGVIVNTEPLHFKAAQHVCKAYGKEFTEDMHLGLIGTTEDYAWQYIVRKLGISINYRRPLQEKAQIYAQLLARDCTPIPGAIEFIKSLTIPCALASSSPRTDIHAVLTRLNLTAHFPVIISGDDILRSKPNPEIYIKAAQKLHIPNQQCLVIEDAVNGIRAAKSAGMVCVALTTSFPFGQLSAADHIIKNFADFQEGVAGMKTEWVWTMKKPQVPLAQGLHVLSFPQAKSILGISTEPAMTHVNGDIYFGKKWIESVERKCREEVRKDDSYPDKLESRIRNQINKLLALVQEPDQEKAGSLTNEELIEKFNVLYNTIAAVTAFMSFKCSVQMSDVLQGKMRLLLSKRISSREERDEMFLLLGTPIEDSFMFKEKKSLLNIATRIDFDADLKRHTEKYGWMGIVMWAGRPFDNTHFEGELHRVRKQSPEAQIKKIAEQGKKQEDAINQAIKELNFNNKEKVFLKQFRTWMHLRTYIKDVTSMGQAATVPILDEIARRVGIAYKDILYLTNEELKNIYGQLPELKKISKARQDGWGFLMVGNLVRYYDARTVKELVEEDTEVSACIKGRVAYPGRVQGRALVISTAGDVDSVKTGDILVTHMTTTSFVPLLSKIAAIVTDEGGITCHAVIVSREMQIPCVIGTRSATKAFKTGDIIEVDATRGVVRKI